MLVGQDGIIIAADSQTHIPEETVGALASSIMGNVRKSLEMLKQTPLKQVTVEASQGKFFLTDTEVGILVVSAESNVNMGLVRLEIKNAASKLKNS